ncbi:hypothetical protein KRX57_06630 [Weeksellaceae bacterium TAE3-ERU29]|nr:hypothetical protein [Weeksellaceae bacterium TAE3-ERU29]
MNDLEKYFNISFPFLVNSEYDLDEVILNFGYSNDEMDSKENHKKLCRKYYELKFTSEGIQKQEINEEKAKGKTIRDNLFSYDLANPEDDYYFSTLNYNEVNKIDICNKLYMFFSYHHIQIIENCYDEINKFLIEAKTDTQANVFLEAVIKTIHYSNFYLNDILKSKNINKIQKYTSEQLIEFNKDLLDTIKDRLKNIFPHILENTAIEENTKQEKENKLRKTFIYKFGSLLAEKVIQIDSEYYQYRGTQYESANALAKKEALNLGVSVSTLSSHLSQTKGGSGHKNNLFHIKQFKYIELIIEDFRKAKKDISPLFMEKYEELKKQVEENYT